jgi:hypothetical protein
MFTTVITSDLTYLVLFFHVSCCNCHDRTTFIISCLHTCTHMHICMYFSAVMYNQTVYLFHYSFILIWSTVNTISTFQQFSMHTIIWSRHITNFMTWLNLLVFWFWNPTACHTQYLIKADFQASAIYLLTSGSYICSHLIIHPQQYLKKKKKKN